MTKKDDRLEIEEEAAAEKVFQAGKHPDHDLSTPEPPVAQPKGKGVGGRAVKDVAAPLTSVTSLLPPSAAIGDPSFQLRVIGSGFDATSVIVFAGGDEPTSYVSENELTTGVDMSVWLGPDPAIPVLVRTGSEETNAVPFAFTPPREVPLDPAYSSKPVPDMNLITQL
jgi:hypothetical protein